MVALLFKLRQNQCKKKRSDVLSLEHDGQPVSCVLVPPVTKALSTGDSKTLRDRIHTHCLRVLLTGTRSGDTAAAAPSSTAGCPSIQPSNSTTLTGPCTRGQPAGSARSPRPAFWDLSYRGSWACVLREEGGRGGYQSNLKQGHCLLILEHKLGRSVASFSDMLHVLKEEKNDLNSSQGLIHRCAGSSLSHNLLRYHHFELTMYNTAYVCSHTHT